MWRVKLSAVEALERPVMSPVIDAPAFAPPADPEAFEKLIPKQRVFSAAREDGAR